MSNQYLFILRLHAVQLIRMKFNSPPTEYLYDVEYHMDEPKKNEDSGLFSFHAEETNGIFRVFLEEGQFTKGNKIYLTVIIKGNSH